MKEGTEIEENSCINLLSAILLFVSASTVTNAQELHPSQQNTSALSPETVKEIKEGFSQAGIDKVTQEALIKKIEAGELIDAINPDMKGKGTITKTETVDARN